MVFAEEDLSRWLRIWNWLKAIDHKIHIDVYSPEFADDTYIRTTTECKDDVLW